MFQGAPGAFVWDASIAARPSVARKSCRLEEPLGLAVVELQAIKMAGTHIDAKAYRYIGCSPVPSAVLLASRPCVKRLLPCCWKEIRPFAFT